MLVFYVITIVILLVSVFLQYLKFKRDIEDRTRVLLLSQKINQILLESLDFETVVQKIADTIPNELKFGTGVLAVYDESDGRIKRIAASRTEEAENAVALLSRMNIPFHSITVSINDPTNLMSRALREKKSFITTDVYDVLGPALTRQQTKMVQDVMSTKTTFIYPIFLQEKPLGVFIASTIKEKNKLSHYELEVLENFVNLVGLSLQNSRLFTSLQQAKSQLESANQRLKVLDKLKDDFVSVASHELRTPMTAIKSYLWMALNKPDIPLSEKMKKYISRSYISTERLINLVNDMLNVSRIEAGRIEIRPKVFDIQVLAEDVITDIVPKASEKMITVSVIKGQVPQIFADPDKIHEVLLNLIGNSLKFTPPGGQISISFFTDGQMVDISVKDTGTGINKDDLSRLFQKFGRLDNSYVAAATSGGTGLGLFISKSLVELMHGKIWASSEGLGKGTTFTFSLPVATPTVVAQAEKYTKAAIGEAKPLEPVSI